ncbi:hypothetical protein AMJ85_02130 [candidate division BRC1 bacterium SM23_51]|nr:MAG: hypothetical protein AMJ85_02130 [candidate division BRC1 bacterium SM23_51]
MARATRAESWSVVAPHRRWGCLAAACFFTLVAVGGFALLVRLVLPRAAINPAQLVGSDVDGLVVVELSRSSPRINRFLQVLIRPISYEVQSRPRELEQEISQLLDVMTFRRAIGLLRYDPVAEREQWAWVIALKRMSEPLKVLVKQLSTQEETAAVETVTSGGALLFFGKQGKPCFAIEQRAIIVASDRDWLGEVLARVENPLEKTPRTNRLCLGLPGASKHCITRACVLLPEGRWEGWADWTESDRALLNTMARVRDLLEQCRLGPSEIESLSGCTIVQPRGQLRFVLTVSCSETSTSEVLIRQMHKQWPQLSADLYDAPYVASVAEPTTSSASVTLSWTSPPVDEILALAPADGATTPSR